jgi:O-antigen/teichoic acid export membrane protein
MAPERDMGKSIVVQSTFSVVTVSLRKWRKHILTGVALNVGFAVGGVIFARLLGTVTQILLARQMGVADFGLYTTVYALLGPIIMITGMGLDTWLLRQSDHTTTLNDTVSQIFSFRLLSTTALMSIGVVVLLFNKQQTDLTLPVVLAVALGLIAELLLTTGYTALRTQIRNRMAALIQMCVAICMILLVWLAWSNKAPLFAATSYRLLANLTGLIILGWVLRHCLRLVWQPPRLWQMLRQARVFFVADILAMITLKADLTFIAIFVGAIAAGIYNPALTIINTTFIVPHVAWQVLLPVIARQRHTPHQLYWSVGLIIAASLLYGLFLAGMLFWGAGWIVHLIYGSQYADAIPLLQVMCLIPLLKSINFCSATLMVAYDAQLLRTRLQAVGSTVNCIGNLVCIPLLGLIGAAWINLITEVTLFVCYGVGAWRTLRGEL